MIRTLALCAAFAAVPAAAQELNLPSEARQLTDRVFPLDSYDLPIAVWNGSEVPTQEFEGRVTKRTWRSGVGSKTTLQVFSSLRDQVSDHGYDIVLDCVDETCGGFDFRFATEVIPSPDMYVSLRDYRFLSAVRGQEALSILVSRNPPDAYLQIISVVPVDVGPALDPQGSTRPGVSEADAINVLEQYGHTVLDDLEFETGSDALGNGPYTSLADLAAWLKQDDTRRVALVGHTDNIGQLEKNVSLSKRRADAVKNRLVEEFDVSADRLETGGVGYLSPLTSNETPEGREANRRVEAVWLSKR